MIPNPPCPRTFPIEYRPPCNLVPTGRAGVNAVSGRSGEPQQEHETGEFGFSELHTTQIIFDSTALRVRCRASQIKAATIRPTASSEATRARII